jgi:hypothetical protein
MVEFRQNFIPFYFCIVIVLTVAVFAAGRPEVAPAIPAGGLEDVWDPDKYISLDEIKPGMEAYCLT